MSNSAYTAFKQGLLGGLYDCDTAVIKVALVRGYTFSAAHTTMADVTAAGGTVNGTATLANVTVTGGVLDADDTIITTVSNAANHYPIVYQASAVGGGSDVAANQQLLMFFYDTGTGIPVAPGNGTYTLTWPNTANKIAKVG